MLFICNRFYKVAYSDESLANKKLKTIKLRVYTH